MSKTHMRLITSPQTPGMPIEINGVTIPVDSWTVVPSDYGQTSGPVQVDLRFFADFPTEPEPETAEQRAERVKAERAAAVAEAVDQWQAVRREHPELVPAFELHRPVAGYQRVDCRHCEQSDGMEATENVPWPCATYTALTGRPEVDRCDQAVEAEPDASAPVIVTIDFRSCQGMSEKDITRVIAKIGHSVQLKN